jgi:hypothetical protein
LIVGMPCTVAYRTVPRPYNVHHLRSQRYSPILTIPDWVLLRGLALCFEDHWLFECHSRVNSLQSDLKLPLIAEIEEEGHRFLPLLIIPIRAAHHQEFLVISETNPATHGLFNVNNLLWSLAAASQQVEIVSREGRCIRCFWQWQHVAIKKLLCSDQVTGQTDTGCPVTVEGGQSKSGLIPRGLPRSWVGNSASYPAACCGVVDSSSWCSCSTRRTHLHSRERKCQ